MSPDPRPLPSDLDTLHKRFEIALRALPSEEQQKDALSRAIQYLALGGVWNPEMMDHRAVSTLIQDLRSALSTVQAQLAAVQDELKEMAREVDLSDV